MAGRGLPWEVPGIPGTSWTDLTPTEKHRCHLVAQRYEKSILVLAGGTSDLIATDDNDTGEVALADMEAYADRARAAGFDKIIALTITPSTWWDADWDVQRLVMNAGIRTSTHWEYVADVANEPRLMDPMNVTYYYDQVHWTVLGNQVAASIVAPYLTEALRQL